jgi:hypothetical protein
MRDERRQASFRGFFAGVTEYVFQTRLGVVDPPLVDYLSELLVRFLRTDELYAVRSPSGERLTQVADMLVEAQHRQGPAKRHAHRHIGDFTLFWTGVYPEVAERMRKSNIKDSLLDYRDQGKRNYRIASSIPVEREVAPSEVLERLSDEFEICTVGLAEVRKLWEENTGESGPIVL